MNKVTEILAVLIRDCPCCSCCSSDEDYIQRVADCFRLVSQDFWPDISDAFKNIAEWKRDRLQQLLDDILKERTS